MAKQKETTIEVHTNILKWLYYEWKDVLVKESDMLQIDITREFMEFLDSCIDTKEPINIAIRGDVGSSKSTVACFIEDKGNTRIEQKYNKKIDRYKSIFSDQTEFIRFSTSGEEDRFIMIDEFSRIAETGLNASTESVLYDYYSDVFAQRRINRVACSPSRILDKNTSVILDFIGKNEELKISKFKVSYRNVAEGYDTRTLGYVTFDVGRILEQDFYKRYRRKKFRRMELMDKHGLRDIRDLEFADIILQVVEDLKDDVIDGTKADIDMINAVVSQICRQNKKIYSMFTTTEIASKVRNILNLYGSICRMDIKLSKVKTAFERDLILKKKKKRELLLGKEMEEEKKRRDLYVEYLDIE